ncbi:hypothetical protein EDF56_103180 [Novosphingobium sp. PhB165]|uniref:DUF192 domain-containing protein n=1 Tax=Novosphingobium sp. PhB165 TaxID=2485105 RepID=UPI0010ECA8C1|nr:DUF192 domain-containing protein [Novosphingobium sp. PhB165]TCM19537.1 hypothetical protein EDF56_103180 [Novosphingobium sp. PhB165]
MDIARKFAAFLLLPVLMLPAACSKGAAEAAATAPSETASVHPESGLAVVPLTVGLASGKSHAFRVEVAATEAEQAKGLMFRTEMGADEGMIFPEKAPRQAAFWMKNTVIPLDILFIGPDHRVLNIAADAVPYDERPLPSKGPVIGVLELNGGRAAQLGIAPGDKVSW